jgi:cytidine deaminase
MSDLTQADQELVQAAAHTLEHGFVLGRHHVAAAIRTSSGRIVTALHLEASTGRIAVCAEAIALGRAIAEGEPSISEVVAVHYPDKSQREPRVLSPCGMCRELVADYCPSANVIYINDLGVVTKATVTTLLPARSGWDKSQD